MAISDITQLNLRWKSGKPITFIFLQELLQLGHLLQKGERMMWLRSIVIETDCKSLTQGMIWEKEKQLLQDLAKQGFRYKV